MSGERRRMGGWTLPVIVAVAGALFLFDATRRGTLSPVALKPVNWAGLAVMVAGAAAALALGRRPLWKLAGVLACGIGAIMVICL